MWGWIGGSWSWITANAAVFSGMATVAMAVIWAVYLQLLLYNFRAEHKPELIINRCKGYDLDSHCILSNLSQGTAFIESVIARLETDRGTFYGDVTDIGYSSDSGKEDIIDMNALRQVTRQGPINKGECIDVGRFGLLIERVARMNGLELDERRQARGDRHFRSIEIMTINIYGRQRSPVGARRGFSLETSEQNEYYLLPKGAMTQQLLSRRQRLEIAKWKRQLEQPSLQGTGERAVSW